MIYYQYSCSLMYCGVHYTYSSSGILLSISVSLYIHNKRMYIHISDKDMDTHHYLWSLITICLYPSKIWWYPPLSQVETLCATPSTSWATLSARHSQGEATEDQGHHGVTQDGDLSGGVEPMQRNEQNDNLLSYLSYFIKLVKMNIQMLFLLHLRDMYPLVN